MRWWTVTAPEEHHEDPEIGYLDDLRALEPLSRPFSDAELAKRRRMMDQPAAVLDQTTFAFLSIMIQEGLM